EVNLTHVDAVRNAQNARGEVQDAGDAGGDEAVGDHLGGVCRGGDHRDPDRLGLDHGRQVVDVAHAHAVDRLADAGRVGVEEGRDVEAAGGEPRVPRQGVTEITHPDEGHRPVLGEAEHLLDLADEGGHVVADAAGAVRAQVGQVLAQLGGVDAGGVGQFLAGDGVVAGLGQ